MIDKWSDGNIMLTHTLIMWGGHVASLVKFCPVVDKEIV